MGEYEGDLRSIADRGGAGAMRGGAGAASVEAAPAAPWIAARHRRGTAEAAKYSPLPISWNSHELRSSVIITISPIVVIVVVIKKATFIHRIPLIYLAKASLIYSYTLQRLV